MPRELSPDQRFDAEYVEVIGADALLLNVLDVATHEKVDTACTAVNGTVEKFCMIANLFPLGAGLAGIRAGSAAFLKKRGDHYQAIGVRIRQWPEEQIVYKRINSRVGADTEAQRKNHRSGERRGLAKLAEGITKVGPERHG